MIRLDFRLPESLRVAYVSAEAEQVWQPRIQAVSNAWSELEWLSVEQGVKPALLTIINDNELLNVTNRALRAGLVAVPLNRTGVTNTYTSATADPNKITNWGYRIVITKAESAASWSEAWNSSNNRAIGTLLGYPPCCIDFFEKYWVQQGFIDTTWPMYMNGGQSTEGPPESNILGRWIGARFVSHLPCSFNCEMTNAMGKNLAELGRKNGFDREIDDLYEILSWPWEWSAAHGILILTNPVLKVVTTTDATGDTVVIQKQGSRYPEEGASGTKFPFINKQKVKVSLSSSFKRSLEFEKEWTDNGFSSKDAMINAHTFLLDKVTGFKFSETDAIIDWGCGNGRLLELMGEKLGAKELYGVEIIRDRAWAAQMRLHHGYISFGSMFSFESWSNKKYKLGILMPGRLDETVEAERKQFTSIIENNVEMLLLYAYSDWVPKFAELVAKYFPKDKWQYLTYDTDGSTIISALIKRDGVSL